VAWRFCARNMKRRDRPDKSLQLAAGALLLKRYLQPRNAVGGLLHAGRELSSMFGSTTVGTYEGDGHGCRKLVV
jgi:hypothetical protein